MKLNSDPVFLFRTLIWISLGSFALCYFESYWEDPFLSVDSRTLLEWDTYNAAITIPPAFFALQAVLFIISLSGLFYFLRSARVLFTWLLVAFGVEWLLTGMRVSPPVGAVVGYVGGLVDGAILLMVYATPLKSRFALHTPAPADNLSKNSAENF